MHIIYFHSTDMRTLTKQLMSYSNIDETTAGELASQGVHGTEHFPVPMQPEENWPLIGDEMQIVRYRMTKLITAIHNLYPLLEGETIEPDGYFASYLADDYVDWPAGTILVRRTTSFGTLYFIDPNFIFNGTAIEGEEYPEVPSLLPDDMGMLAPETAVWTTLAISIGKSLISGFASKVGASIFSAIFPPGKPPYFDEVYAEFERIIQRAIEENQRRLMRASIASIQDGMRTYNVIRKDPTKFEESQRMLSQFWNESRLLTNTLREFKEVGLGLFSVAGGLHLAILQERALTDKAHKDPNKSPWASELIEKAREFSKWAEDTRSTVIRVRGEAITEVILVNRTRHIPRSGPVDDSYYLWEDRMTGQRFTYNKRGTCCGANPLTTARNARQRRWNETVVMMTTKFEPLKEAISSWNKLTSQPIPITG